jgi:hypothetical protein
MNGSIPAGSNGGARLDGELEVTVQREWNGWRTSRVKLRELRDIHWFQPAGAPRPLIHACVAAPAMTPRDASHQDGATAAEVVRVCVLKRHVAAHVFQELARCAQGSRGVRTSAPQAPATSGPAPAR